jgi:hypothetical protein
MIARQVARTTPNVRFDTMLSTIIDDVLLNAVMNFFHFDRPTVGSPISFLPSRLSVSNRPRAAVKCVEQAGENRWRMSNPRAVFVVHGDESFSFGQPCSLLGKMLATLPKFKYIDLID